MLDSYRFGNPEIGRDENGEYFLFLNAARNGPYTKGDILTRYKGPGYAYMEGEIYNAGGIDWTVPDFGENPVEDIPLFPGLGGSGSQGGRIFTESGNAVAFGLGTSVSVKAALIDYAVKPKVQTGTLKTYTTGAKAVGKVCTIITIGYAFENLNEYEERGGNNNWVRVKYYHDVINALAPYIASGSPAGPYVLAGSIIYSLVDYGTDGFSMWIDYSTPY